MHDGPLCWQSTPFLEYLLARLLVSTTAGRDKDGTRVARAGAILAALPRPQVVPQSAPPGYRVVAG